jgi:hypothetical protein
MFNSPIDIILIFLIISLTVYLMYKGTIPIPLPFGGVKYLPDNYISPPITTINEPGDKIKLYYIEDNQTKIIFYNLDSAKLDTYEPYSPLIIKDADKKFNYYELDKKNKYEVHLYYKNNDNTYQYLPFKDSDEIKYIEIIDDKQYTFDSIQIFLKSQSDTINAEFVHILL